MAPIKFEESIREKLEERSLQPSMDAWQNLEQKLNADSKKRNKSKFWWFGIAASFIGLLFVVSQFMSFENTNQVITPIIVDSNTDTINKAIESPQVIEDDQQIVYEEPKTHVSLKVKKVSTPKTKVEKLKIEEKASVLKTGIAENKEAPSASELSEVYNQVVVTSITNPSDLSPEIKTELVTTETSDSEIENLLITANKELQLKVDGNINTLSVDANALLEDVETEMPPSLRGQLFKVIEKNFKTAKTAVATRNE